jgi:hypothetical protein
MNLTRGAVSADLIIAEATESSSALIFDESHDEDLPILTESIIYEEPPKMCSPEPSQIEPQQQLQQPQLQQQQQPFQSDDRTMKLDTVADIGWKRYGLVTAVFALSLCNFHLFVSQ